MKPIEEIPSDINLDGSPETINEIIDKVNELVRAVNDLRTARILDHVRPSNNPLPSQLEHHTATNHADFRSREGSVFCNTCGEKVRIDYQRGRDS